MELSACRHRERILSGASNDELHEDLHLHMGTGEIQHMLMIAMALFENVTEELHGETCSRNVARCARGEASRGGGKGAASSSLQITTDKEASEIKKVRSDQSTDKGSGRQGAKSSS